MKFAEAFKSLGYDLKSPRQDWSAVKADGVCISLWAKELSRIDEVLVFDSTVHGGPLEEWSTKPGNSKRKTHFESVESKHDGWLDVVIVTGTPGQAYESASPWIVNQRKNYRWRLINFDKNTGHFKVETHRYQL
jgi:hypothetical protein